jgi:hypothetical protein
MRSAWRAALALLLAASALLWCIAGVEAAEVLQVRSGSLLQVGDHNRTYSVELACLAISPDDDAAAAAWLRSTLPRRTRVNLRPVGNREGMLLARVSRLNGTEASSADLSDGLIAAGLASRPQDCSS